MLTESTISQLVEQYTDLLALGWRQRTAALDSWTETYQDLSERDERLEQFVGALQILGSRTAQVPVAETFATMMVGELFVYALDALRRQDFGRWDLMLEGARGEPHLGPAVESAVEWAPAEFSRWMSPDDRSMHLKIRAAALFGESPLPGSSVSRWTAAEAHSEASLSALLFFARHRGDLVLAERVGGEALEHALPEIRLAAAETLWGLRSARFASGAHGVLQQLVHEGGSSGMAALPLLVSESALSMEALWSEVGNGDTRRCLLALGWSGEVDAISRLMEYLDEPPYARLAGAALRLITGSDPVEDEWQGAAFAVDAVGDEEGSVEIPLEDPDREHGWPSSEGFGQWWHNHRSDFAMGTRYFAGHPFGVDALRRVVRSGPLAWRAPAALRLQRLTGHRLFPTHIPACQQDRLPINVVREQL